MGNKRNRINKKYSTHKNKVIFIKKKLPTMKKKTRHNQQTIDKQTMDKQTNSDMDIRQGQTMDELTNSDMNISNQQTMDEQTNNATGMDKQTVLQVLDKEARLDGKCRQTATIYKLIIIIKNDTDTS